MQLNVVAQKTSGRPKKMWAAVLVDDKRKCGMDSADPQSQSGEDVLEEDLSDKPNPC